MPYQVKKRYGHELGLSACFRQHRATSHCRLLHGYALSFEFTFEADELDENGWVIDFGGLKPLKAWLCDTFDHKLLVAADDPHRERLELLMPMETATRWGEVVKVSTPEMRAQHIADVLVVPAVGCEAFARMAWKAALEIVPGVDCNPHPDYAARRTRVRLVSVEVREHGANAAIYMGEPA